MLMLRSYKIDQVGDLKIVNKLMAQQDTSTLPWKGWGWNLTWWQRSNRVTIIASSSFWRFMGKEVKYHRPPTWCSQWKRWRGPTLPSDPRNGSLLQRRSRWKTSQLYGWWSVFRYRFKAWKKAEQLQLWQAFAHGKIFWQRGHTPPVRQWFAIPRWF